MLKWTVPTKREGPLSSTSCTSSRVQQRRSIDTVRERKQRRASRRRASLCVRADKENRQSAPPTSLTPSRPLTPLRDVSNITPQTPPVNTRPRKKQCVHSHNNCDGGVSSTLAVTQVYSSTLPSFQMEYSPCMRDATTLGKPYIPQFKPCSVFRVEENCSPNKKPKIDHVNDFLHQISFITSPEDFRLKNLQKFSTKETISGEVTVSPLLKKFVDLRFSQISFNENDDTTGFNDMSLDKIVDAILDTTMDSNRLQPDDKSNSTYVFGHKEEQEDSKRKRTNSTSEETNKRRNIKQDNTFILNETYNERLVQTPNEPKSESSLEKSDFNRNESFSLKRQRCIRRRKQLSSLNSLNNNHDDPNVTPVSAHQEPNSSSISNDTSFSSSCMSVTKSDKLECYSPWRNDCCGLSTPSLANVKRETPLKRSVSASMATSTPAKWKELTTTCGAIEVQIACSKGVLNVNVVSCSELQRTNGGPINAYVKVALIPEQETRSRKRGGPQRTAVQAESDRPRFDHRFTFRLSKRDLAKRIQLEVWHRDRSQRRSELLGCLSFPVKHAVKKEINGTHKLQSQSSRQDSTITHPPQSQGNHQITMGENSQSSCEEILSVDDVSNSTPNLVAQQRDADENLFLRYLELDPVEGPEAAGAALQRKASGNRGGRTPFTITKKLMRPPRQGFGFSVVWTHPPRIERVEKGLSADKAGILPGDYIIFVDKHNVVMMPEIDILNLIRSYGSQLTLEIFRRNSSRNGSVSAGRPMVSIHEMSSEMAADLTLPLSATTAFNGTERTETSTLPPTTLQALQRPSTGCSTNTELSRRRLHLPQVTFTSEKAASTPEEARKRAMYQLINKEQQYVTALQFAVTRFVSALAERRDLLSPHEHHVLFQNSEEILRITEDILEHLVHDDGEPQIQLLPKTYELKLTEIISAYKRYCAGLKRADYLLATKTKNSNSEFVRFLQQPAIPRRRPDITSFIHKPLEHYRDILKLLSTILSHTKPHHVEYPSISRVVHDLQVVYREITAEAGLMEPVGEGRPLLSVQDLENRLVFTKCKPFVLSKPGRQWIFGGDLSRVEGRTIRTYWALLFSDLLLFAKVSRDRVLFITEEPLPLSHITEVYFNVRKKATEFRMTVEAGGRTAQSPTAHCGPDLSRTPRKHASRRCVVLRAPTMELKAVWQNLLQRQLDGRMNQEIERFARNGVLVPTLMYGIECGVWMTKQKRRVTALEIRHLHGVCGYMGMEHDLVSLQQLSNNHYHMFHVNSGVDGSALSSPLESPDVPMASSVGTLQSAESPRQTGSRSGQVAPMPMIMMRGAWNKAPHHHVHSSLSSEMQKQIDELIEHKCKQLSKTCSNKGGAIHLEQWMKGQLGSGRTYEPDSETEPEPEPELWTAEELRKRSEELQLLDMDHVSRCEEFPLSDQEHERSPSRSTTTESQVTVRSSPLVPEQVSVCKQCHETCLSNTNSPNLNIHHTNNNVIHNKCHSNGNVNVTTNNRIVNNVNVPTKEEEDNEWGSLMLMGLAAINPTTSFVKLDPFAPKIVPKIAVVPPTPDQTVHSLTAKFNYCNDISSNSPLRRKILTNLDLVKDYEESPDDSPQNEHPYIALDNCNTAIRRFGTLSSLEKLTNDNETLKNSSSGSESEEDEENSTKTDPGQQPAAFTTSLRSWTAKAGSFVSEKMAFFERFTDDSREGFFDRYLKQNDVLNNLDEDGNIGHDEECETSGATSGEEIWGTPTSGGELDDPLAFPNSEGGNLSPQSVNSTGGEDDTELMMDELLMAPPMTAAAVRGLLPRRRLEPLMEEDDSDTYTTSSSSSSSDKATPSPEEGSGTGAVADACSCAARAAGATGAAPPTPSTCPVACTTPLLARSRSYRHIVDEAEERALQSPLSQPFLVNFPVITKYKSIEPSRPLTAPANAHAARPKSTRLFDFFSARRSERRVHESFSGGRQLLRVFSTKESPIPETVPNEFTPTPKPLSPMLNKDKQMDRRFWRQLSKRRRANRVPQIPA